MNDLIIVLNNKIIVFVVLDVFEEEFFFEDSFLWEMQNVLLIFYIFGMILKFKLKLLVIFILNLN